MKELLSKILQGIHRFLGVSAIVSGILFLLDPLGGLLAIPIEELEGTPFTDYRIPGLLLFVLIGLGNSIAFYVNRRQRGLVPYSAIFSGGVLMVWIVVQVLMIGLTFFLQPLFFSLGLFMVIVGIILIKR